MVDEAKPVTWKRAQVEEHRRRAVLASDYGETALCDTALALFDDVLRLARLICEWQACTGSSHPKSAEAQERALRERVERAEQDYRNANNAHVRTLHKLDALANACNAIDIHGTAATLRVRGLEKVARYLEDVNSARIQASAHAESTPACQHEWQDAGGASSEHVLEKFQRCAKCEAERTIESPRELGAEGLAWASEEAPLAARPPLAVLRDFLAQVGRLDEMNTTADVAVAARCALAALAEGRT